MKNLMIYISSTRSFDNSRGYIPSKEAEKLAKIQIDNSLQLGWKKKDIMLVTNFKWEYGSIKAKVLKEVEIFEPMPQVNKINAIVKLFEKGRIKNKEIYWFHDLDAFQLQEITDSELDLENCDMALTDYGRRPRWSTGVIYFKKSAKDIFKKIKDTVYEGSKDEEWALYKLTRENAKIRNRVKKIDKSYNFTAFNIRSCYRMAIKPIRVVHFHPFTGIRQLGVENSLKFFLGDNKIRTPLLTKRLISIFKYHGIKIPLK